jgi:hypothetical protein
MLGTFSAPLAPPLSPLLLLERGSDSAGSAVQQEHRDLRGSTSPRATLVVAEVEVRRLGRGSRVEAHRDRDEAKAQRRRAERARGHDALLAGSGAAGLTGTGGLAGALGSLRL